MNNIAYSSQQTKFKKWIKLPKDTPNPRGYKTIDLTKPEKYDVVINGVLYNKAGNTNSQALIPYKTTVWDWRTSLQAQVPTLKVKFPDIAKGKIMDFGEQLDNLREQRNYIRTQIDNPPKDLTIADFEELQSGYNDLKDRCNAMSAKEFGYFDNDVFNEEDTIESDKESVSEVKEKLSKDR